MTPVSFRERLQWLRMAAFLSQRELARLAGLTNANVCWLEAGHDARVEARTVHAIAVALGTTMDWLYAGAGEAPRLRQIGDAIARARAKV